jgi:hypothetical protein
MSRFAGSIGRHPYRLSPVTPGSVGCRDAADPNAGLQLGDTPGSLGHNDCGDPDAKPPYGLGLSNLHVTVSWDRDLLLWDYDPNKLLDDERLCPEFVEQAHSAMRTAIKFGLRPQIHEAYRSPAESDRKHALWKKKRGGRAAPGWHSVHNYGLAMDVWLYDRKHKYIDTKVKGWFALYKLLAKACSPFLWGEPFDDSDHFEYHPNWVKPAKGDLMIPVRDWAIKARRAATQESSALENLGHKSPSEKDLLGDGLIKEWLPYFWWAAGAAEDHTPSAAYLTSNRPPVQG